MRSVCKKEYLEVTYPQKSGEYPGLLSDWIKKNVFLKTGSLLDIGCGNGEYLKEFDKLGYDVFGIDISPKVKDIEGYKTKQVNLEIQHFPGVFDFVFSKSTIEHIKNVDIFVSNARASLKYGGKLCFMTPAWEYCYQNFYNCHTHVSPFTRESLTNILLIYGFKNVKVDYFYQLPVVWKYPSVKYACKLINFLKIPYNNNTKFLRFSREVMLLAEGEK